MSKRAIFDKKNILVTGGAGFIGSHLCDRLVENNKVICIDNFLTGDQKNIDHLLKNPNFVFIKADINEALDLEACPELQPFKIQFQGVQEIYNLACPMSPIKFKENKVNNLLVNSIGIKNMLDLATKYGAKFIHFSSSVVYGPRRDDDKKITESDFGVVNPVSERSSYDEGKRFAESMVINYRDVYDLDIKIARIFRAYGPRMKLDEQHMIPDFVDNALDGNDVIIFGDKDFSSSLCYVEDIIDGIIKLSDSDITSPVNLGADLDENLTTVAQKIIELTESNSKIKYQKEVLFMTPLMIPNITKAKTELSWMPVTTLDQGLQKTVDYLRAHKGLLNVKHAV